jgi:hypothetical protein
VRLQPVPNTEASRNLKGMPITVVKTEREIDDNELYMIKNRLDASTENIHNEIFGSEKTEKTHEFEKTDKTPAIPSPEPELIAELPSKNLIET